MGSAAEGLVKRLELLLLSEEEMPRIIPGRQRSPWGAMANWKRDGEEEGVLAHDGAIMLWVAEEDTPREYIDTVGMCRYIGSLFKEDYPQIWECLW